MQVDQGARGRKVILRQEVGDHLEVSDTKRGRLVRIRPRLVSEYFTKNEKFPQYILDKLVKGIRIVECMRHNTHLGGSREAAASVRIILFSRRL